jgi:hypothetical protein
MKNIYNGLLNDNRFQSNMEFLELSFKDHYLQLEIQGIPLFFLICSLPFIHKRNTRNIYE